MLLYEGKDRCVLDPNAYSGITLLYMVNKSIDMSSLWDDTISVCIDVLDVPCSPESCTSGCLHVLGFIMIQNQL